MKKAGGGTENYSRALGDTRAPKSGHWYGTTRAEDRAEGRKQQAKYTAGEQKLAVTPTWINLLAPNGGRLIEPWDQKCSVPWCSEFRQRSTTPQYGTPMTIGDTSLCEYHVKRAVRELWEGADTLTRASEVCAVPHCGRRATENELSLWARGGGEEAMWFCQNHLHHVPEGMREWAKLLPESQRYQGDEDLRQGTKRVPKSVAGTLSPGDSWRAWQ